MNDIRDISNDILQCKDEGIIINSATKEEIYNICDIISLHIPSYKLTNNLISEKSLKYFSRESFLINTARGELIDEDALYLALKESKIAGAALDVFQEEPYRGKLGELENVILTQHMGSCSYDCRSAMETQAAEDAIRFLNGIPLLREVPELEYSYQ